jgi:hypothetical protein
MGMFWTQLVLYASWKHIANSTVVTFVLNSLRGLSLRWKLLSSNQKIYRECLSLHSRACRRLIIPDQISLHRIPIVMSTLLLRSKYPFLNANSVVLGSMTESICRLKLMCYPSMNHPRDFIDKRTPESSPREARIRRRIGLRHGSYEAQFCAHVQARSCFGYNQCRPGADSGEGKSLSVMVLGKLPYDVRQQLFSYDKEDNVICSV